MADQFELEVLARMPNYYSWIMETFAPFVCGHVVEYGAGMGTVSQQLAPLAQQLTLVEPSTDLAASLRAKFCDDQKVVVDEDSLEQHAARTGAATVDTIVMVNVLEHIADDRQALAYLFYILRPGGCILTFVPALQKLMSKIDLKFGHFRRYSRTDLADKIGAAGGDVQLCRYFDFFGVLPWLLLNKLMGATRFNPHFVRLHDKFVVPISRSVERVITPPIGKNLILVARKR